MGWFIVIVGVFLMVMGAALILIPHKVLHLSQKMLAIKNFKRLGWIPIIVGFLLCISANFSYLAVTIFLIGLLLIAKGAYIFVTPLDKLKKLKIFSLSDKMCRIIGIVILIVGMVLINAAM